MSQTRDQQAYQRGIKAARLWKRLKGTILRWDHACVSSARKHKLPGWIGHIPMGMLAVIMLTALVFGGMVIASSAVLVSALVLLVSGANTIEERTSSDDCNSSDLPQKTYESPIEYNAHGDAGPGWYASGFKLEDDD
ncbi:hypothetical protein AAH178_002902 [Serratia marcescens]